jgi:peptidoglycan hydrolase-like protein with peptidoglycan-binding domain
LAVDIHSAAEPKRIQWLIDNVKEFGWSWEVVPSEPWHIRYVNGDKIPAAVAMYMERNGITKPAVSAAPAPAAAAKQAAPAVAPKAAPAAPAAEEPEAKMTKKDIDQIQKALKAKGFFEGEITGVMSPETRNAIKAFKKANGFKIVNGIAGGAFLKKLGLK